MGRVTRICTQTWGGGEQTGRVKQLNSRPIDTIDLLSLPAFVGTMVWEARVLSRRELHEFGDLDDATTTIAMVVEATGFDLSRGVGAPQIDGAVLQYRADQKLVHINRGTNNKVKRGYIFDIYSGDTYKGQARVEVVNPDTCTAVLVATTGSAIAQGDLVSTQI